MSCCKESCWVRVYENGQWFYRCLNCKKLTPA